MLARPDLQVKDPAFDAWCDKLIAIYDGALAKAKAECGAVKE
jgi:hypothetical protein